MSIAFAKLHIGSKGNPRRDFSVREQIALVRGFPRTVFVQDSTTDSVICANGKVGLIKISKACLRFQVHHKSRIPKRTEVKTAKPQFGGGRVIQEINFESGRYLHIPVDFKANHIAVHFRRDDYIFD